MERTYSGDEIAAEISAVFGRPVRYQPIAVADWAWLHDREVGSSS
jgi:hypothetical protein